MMKTAYKALLAILLAAMLTLCFFLPSALADATEVWVNNVKLTSSLPYWTNGETAARATAPDGQWNAYFNTADSSVTLRGAVINTMHAVSTGYYTEQALVFANGAITVTLLGHNSLQYAQASTDDLYGIIASGNLTLSGSGSADIQVRNTASNTALVYAVYSSGNLAVQGGTYNVDIQGPHYTYGFYAYWNILFAGGTTVVNGTASAPRTAYTSGGYFRMTGGSLFSTLECTYADARGIYALDAYLEGGTGSFISTGAGTPRGMLLSDGPLHVTGGFFRFSGGGEAICINEIPYVLDLDPAVAVYVSEAASGAGMRRWTSLADGKLAGNDYPYISSPFRFVQFGEPLAVSSPPQTGDPASPWLWAGIGLPGLLGAAWIARQLRAARRAAVQ